MLHRMRLWSLCLLFICGCSTSTPLIEPPSCGPPVDSETVKVVEAEQLDGGQDFNAVFDYATEQAGSFQLISEYTFRVNAWPGGTRKPRWVNAQEAAASRGCDILILVHSEMLLLPNHGWVDGAGRPSLYLYFLLGSRVP